MLVATGATASRCRCVFDSDTGTWSDRACLTASAPVPVCSVALGRRSRGDVDRRRRGRRQSEICAEVEAAGGRHCWSDLSVHCVTLRSEAAPRPGFGEPLALDRHWCGEGLLFARWGLARGSADSQLGSDVLGISHATSGRRRARASADSLHDSAACRRTRPRAPSWPPLRCHRSPVAPLWLPRRCTWRPRLCVTQQPCSSGVGLGAPFQGIVLRAPLRQLVAWRPYPWILFRCALCKSGVRTVSYN